MRLLIADDSLIARTGLTTILTGLRHEIVGYAERAEQVLPLVARTLPDLVVMDIHMPPTLTDEGIRLAAAIRDRHPRVAVLVVSQDVEPAYAGTLLSTGVKRVGYLLKDRVFTPRVLQEAMNQIVAGGTAIEEELVAQLLRRPGDAALDTLTARELDVLKLMAQGLTDQGIAERLGVGRETVSSHVKQIFHKLGLPRAATDNRRVQAVLEYIRRRPGSDPPLPSR